MQNTPTTIEIDGRNYEVVNFNSKQTNKSSSVRGIALAQGFLAIAGVGGSYRIYNTQSGEPVIKGRFSDFKDALKFAFWIEEVYADYFDIWKAYPQADLFLWCRYTVPNGVVLFDTVEILNDLDMITSQDMTKAYQKAKGV